MKVVYTDIETAGLDFWRPIIQIAAIAVNEQLRELEAIEIKIKFHESHADPRALSANKYNPDVWRQAAISSREAAVEYARFLRRHATYPMVSADGTPYQVAQLAGHNAERFDGPFLHAWYRRQRIFCPARYMTLCTKQKALWLFDEYRSLAPPADFKLGTLCQYFGVTLRNEDAHDALADVRATVELCRAMREHERREHAQAA